MGYNSQNFSVSYTNLEAQIACPWGYSFYGNTSETSETVQERIWGENRSQIRERGRQRMAQTQGFMTALYERLSRDDELNGESQSEKTRSSMQRNMALQI